MTLATGSQNAAIGYLTVRKEEDLGYIGGYLLLNAQARPLEFHCTAPVTPNRAQKILYGRTLPAYLYGERIGVTLAQRSKTKPQFLVTDRFEILNARKAYPMPVLCLADDPTEHHVKDPELQRIRLPQVGAPDDKLITGWVASSARTVIETFHQTHEVADWWEPFDRIDQAISEAQRPAA